MIIQIALGILLAVAALALIVAVIRDPGLIWLGIKLLWALAVALLCIALLIAWAALGVYLWFDDKEIFAVMIASMFAGGVYLVVAGIREAKREEAVRIEKAAVRE